MIRTVGNGRNFLKRDDLAYLTSLTAVAPSPVTSGKYRQVKTMDIVDLFGSLGWMPVTAQEQRVVKVEREGFQKHLLRFRRENVPPILDNLHLEIALTNAHDATASYRLMAAIFRCICLNGLMVSQGSFGEIRIPHINFEPHMILDASKAFAERLPLLEGEVKTYQAIELSAPERTAFAESALLVKFDPPENVIPMRLENGMFQIDKRDFDTRRLLKPYRPEEQKPTLWNTYNTIQEKFQKGFKFECDNSPNRRYSFQEKKVRGITGIDEKVRVNQGLWHLMETMNELKSAAV